MNNTELLNMTDLSSVFSLVEENDSSTLLANPKTDAPIKATRVGIRLLNYEQHIEGCLQPIQWKNESAWLLMIANENAHREWNSIENTRLLDFSKASKDWFWELDNELRYTWLSNNIEAVTGYPPEHYYGTKRSDYAPSSAIEKQKWNEHIAQMECREPIVEFVFRTTRTDGQTRWIRTVGAPYFDAAGKFCGYRGTGSDINDLKLLEIAIRENEQRFRQFAETASDWFWEMDSDYRFSYMSENVKNVTRESPEFYIGKSRQELFGDDLLENPIWAAHYEKLDRREDFRDFVYQTHKIDGDIQRWIRVSGSPVFSADGVFQGYRGCASEITKHVEDQLARERSEERFRDFSEIAADWFWELDADLKFVYVSDRFFDICGVEPQRLLGMYAGELESKNPGYKVSEVAVESSVVEFFQKEQPVVEWQFNWLHPDGRTLRISLNSRPIYDNEGNCTGHRGIATDVTHSHQLSKELEFRANHDVLTGLYNRLEFDRYVKAAVDKANETGSTSALLYIDLDQFKIVNDSVGHLAGDELLKTVADLIRSQVRKSDIVARLGGDEFGVLLDECTVSEAGRIANLIADIIREFTFTWDDQAFRVSTSIGVVAIRELTNSVTEIMSNADIACYAAKDAGRNRINYYEEQDEAVRRQRTQIFQAAGIRDSLNNGRFRLFKQVVLPITAEETVLRFELLLRLLDNDNKVISPGAVIPAAERFGLMPSIDRWVLKTAFEKLHKLRAMHPGCIVSINLSGTTISDSSLPQYIESLTNSNSIEPGSICFEVTETALISNLNTATSTIKSVKELGHSFALDDFGSGMSSFAYLKHLPVDFLKIDGGFVKDIVQDETDYAVVAAINEVAHRLGIQTIAEYVESVSIFEKLIEIGVDYGQGFALGKPVPLDDADAIRYYPQRSRRTDDSDSPLPVIASVV